MASHHGSETISRRVVVVVPVTMLALEFWQQETREGQEVQALVVPGFPVTVEQVHRVRVMQAETVTSHPEMLPLVVVAAQAQPVRMVMVQQIQVVPARQVHRV